MGVLSALLNPPAKRAYPPTFLTENGGGTAAGVLPNPAT